MQSDCCLLLIARDAGEGGLSLSMHSEKSLDCRRKADAQAYVKLREDQTSRGFTTSMPR
jgi:hypothetical protein